jgi:pimeloyl-ACP methyl ester carboxylesterase
MKNSDIDSTPFARERWLDHDGTRLFASDAGEGPPLLFLHGGLADHRAVTLRFGALTRDVRLIAPDLRGSGRSVFRGTLSWQLLADDLAAWMTSLGIARAVVGGISMGSGVAVHFALRHADRLRGLVLMSPVYPGASRPLPDAAARAMRALGEVGKRVAIEGLTAARPLFEALPEPTRAVALQMLAGFDPASVAATTAFLAAETQPLASAEQLASIDVPTLVIPGTDREHPTEVATLYTEHLGQPQVAGADATLPERLVRFCRALA